MKERDYILSSNLARLRIIKDIVSDCCTGNVMSDKERQRIVIIISKAIDRSYALVDKRMDRS